MKLFFDTRIQAAARTRSWTAVRANDRALVRGVTAMPLPSLRIGTVLLLILLQGLLVGSTFAQTISLRSPVVNRGASTLTTALIRASDTVTLRWDRTIAASRLKIGTRPGEYAFRNVPLPAGRQATFTPEVVGLPVGVYYGVVTTSSENSLVAIQLNASTDNSVEYSGEFQFVVESVVTPRIVGPRSQVASRTPLFEWEPVPGVPAYALVMSSAPFTIGSNSSTGELSIEGINLVWALLTTGTSALYGEKATANPVISFEAQPLVPGRTYYYTVLNAYSTTDTSLLSPVTGTMVSFSVQDSGGLSPAELISPRGNVLIEDQEVIDLQWNPVQGATSYDVSVFERQTTVSTTADVLVFTERTTDRRVSVPARQVLRSGRHSWFVIANDGAGAGSVSETAIFRNNVPMGTFTFRTSAGPERAELLGVTVSIRATDGGYNPPNPLVNATSLSYSDSLRAGRYVFQAQKIGYADSSFAVQIRSGAQTEVDINLRQLSARISGQVVDDSGQPLSGARVTARHVVTSLVRTTHTTLDGQFSLALAPGTYEFMVTLEGFRPSTPIVLTLARNAYIVLPQAIPLVEDNIPVSGRVLTSTGSPVALAEVSALAGSQRVSTTTNANGGYAMSLSEGEWTMEATRPGLVSSGFRMLTVARGDVVSNFDFILGGASANLSGTVLEQSLDQDGQVVRTPLEGAVVWAVPAWGPSIQRTTDSRGRFSFDLSEGGYTLAVDHAGVVPAPRLDLHVQTGDRVSGIAIRVDMATAVVEGRVLSASGEGLSNLVVVSSSGVRTRTTAGGNFRLQTRPGQQSIRVEGLSRFMASPMNVWLDAERMAQLPPIVLASNALRVSGRVQSRNGVAAAVPIRAVSAADTLVSVSSPDGTFFIALPPGTWELVSASPLYGDSAPVVVRGTGGQSVSGIQLDLPGSLRVFNGHITSGTQPVTGADIRVRTGHGTIGTQSRMGGYFSMLVPDGKDLQVETVAEGYMGDVRPVGVAATFKHVIDLEPYSAVLSGRVVDRSGRGVTDATIRISSTTRPDTVLSPNALGEFQLGVTPGTLDITVEGPGWLSQSRSVLVQAGQSRDMAPVVLTRIDGSLLVAVRSADGDVLVGARVQASGVTIRERITGTNGQASIVGLPQGSYELRVASPGYQGESRQVMIEAGAALDVSFSLVPNAAAIHGTVSEANGDPVSGATVTLVMGTERHVTETRSDGLYRIPAIAAGTWTLEAFRSGYATFLLPSVVVATEDVEQMVTLVPLTGRLSARVVDASSSDGIWNAEVRVSSMVGTASALTGPDGRSQLSGLPDGPARVRISHPGYNTEEQDVTIPVQDEAQLTAVLRPLSARLSGRVRTTAGSTLPFSTTVVVEIGTVQREAQTDSEGRWSMDRLPESVLIRIRTRLGRQGYSEAFASTTIPFGTVQSQAPDLVVQQRSATLSGFVQLDGVTVDVANGQLEARSLSLSDGSYRLEGLSAGTWRVVPSKPGYAFVPTERMVQTESTGSVFASFVPMSDLAAVEIRVSDGSGRPVEGVPVLVTSLDRRIVRQAETGVAGLVTPSELPGGYVYRVEPVEALTRFEPASALVDVLTARQAAVSFTRVPATARVSAPLRNENGATVLNAIVELFDDTGDLVQSVTTGTGQFALGPVPAGSYVLRVRSTGHLDVQRSILLEPDAELVLNNIILFRRNVRISGRIMRAGLPVQGQSVALDGIQGALVQTGDDGRFVISDVPLGLAGSKVLELVVVRPGQPDIRRSLIVDESDIQPGVLLPDIVLSSGQIRIRATRSGQALSGVQLTVDGPFLTRLDLSTDALGRASTPARLDAGTYAIAARADTLLRPIPFPEAHLSTPTSVVDVELELPYRHTPVPESVTSLDTLLFRIEGTRRSGDRARLRLSGLGATVPLIPDTSGWVLKQPPPGPLPFTYSLEVSDSTGRLAYATPRFERSPRVAGRLATVRLEPDVSGRVLRLGGEYRTTLVVRDETGRELDARFLPGLPGASVTWVTQGPAVQVQPDPATGGLAATLVASSPGESSLTVLVRVDGVARELVIPVQVKDVTVSEVAVAVDRQRVFNDGGRVQFTVAGKTSSGEDVLLGSGFTIRLVPDGVGTLSGNTLQLHAPDFIGPLTVVVEDGESGLDRTVELSAFARVNALSAIELRDSEDVRFRISRNAFTEAGELTLRRDAVPSGKRFANGGGVDPAVSVSDRSVRFLFRSERALPGDSLAVPATLTMANRSGLRLLEGLGELVQFDDRNLKWLRIPSTDTGTEVHSDVVTRIGEYALAITSRPLTIRHAALLPTPFSPQDGAMRIGYLLESTRPPVTVSIFIVNARGERIRTLLSRTPQWPGRYGSNSGLQRLEWDGRTDSGKWARNGRYLVYIEAEDETGSIREVLQAVLVK